MHIYQIGIKRYQDMGIFYPTPVKTECLDNKNVKEAIRKFREEVKSLKHYGDVAALEINDAVLVYHYKGATPKNRVENTEGKVMDFSTLESFLVKS